MRHTLIVILFLSGHLCYANMDSPFVDGTCTGSAISSRDIDIVKEKIRVTLDKDFQTAYYVVEYFIKTDTKGKQIPLLFYANNYKGDFKVWVDNYPIKLLSIPSQYITTANTPFEKFSNSFDTLPKPGNPEHVVIHWNNQSYCSYNLNDLKYFEIDLTKGEHKIRVEYTAKAWIVKNDWIKDYSFGYALAPAKNWKSFGSLEITMDATAINSLVTTNVGRPARGKLDGIAVWNFSKLPADYFAITFEPSINVLAKLMIAISPIGLAIIFSSLITLLHFLALKKYRIQNPSEKYSWVLIIGSIIIPFLMLLSFPLSFQLIDIAIGVAASKYHGYEILVMIFYPLLLPVYWLIMWGVDKAIKRKINNPS